MRIVIVNLNPGVDRVIYLPTPMQPGTMNRAAQTIFCQGSKAANQAMLLSALGGGDDVDVDIHVYTFTGGPLGPVCDAFTALPGITTHAIPTEAGIRVNTKVIDADGVCTELNERGGPVTAEELELLISSLRTGCENVDILSIAGSIPQGVEKSVYKSLIEANLAERVILDCDGEQLRLAVKANPYLIKPNRRELAGLVSAEGVNDFSPALGTTEEVITACGLVREKTAERTNILCTLDVDGSIYVGSEGVWRVNAPAVPFRGFSGAGDTYLAAFTWGRFAQGKDLPDALRYGAAAASAKVAKAGTNLPARDEIEALTEAVVIEKLA